MSCVNCEPKSRTRINSFWQAESAEAGVSEAGEELATDTDQIHPVERPGETPTVVRGKQTIIVEMEQVNAIERGIRRKLGSCNDLRIRGLARVCQAFLPGQLRKKGVGREQDLGQRSRSCGKRRDRHNSRSHLPPIFGPCPFASLSNLSNLPFNVSCLKR